MWVENIQELKRRSGMTVKQIAEASQIPEGTVKRIINGENEPSAFNLFRVVRAMGGSLDDILADTNAIIAPPSLVEVKETVETVEAEKEVAVAKNDILESKIVALEKEIALLKSELQHKDELLAVHNYYIGIMKKET
jgi:transcriptional regulator with XRE-family HTH domain